MGLAVIGALKADGRDAHRGGGNRQRAGIGGLGIALLGGAHLEADGAHVGDAGGRLGPLALAHLVFHLRAFHVHRRAGGMAVAVIGTGIALGGHAHGQLRLLLRTGQRRHGSRPGAFALHGLQGLFGLLGLRGLFVVLGSFGLRGLHILRGLLGLRGLLTLGSLLRLDGLDHRVHHNGHEPRRERTGDILILLAQQILHLAGRQLGVGAHALAVGPVPGVKFEAIVLIGAGAVVDLDVLLAVLVIGHPDRGAAAGQRAVLDGEVRRGGVIVGNGGRLRRLLLNGRVDRRGGLRRALRLVLRFLHLGRVLALGLLLGLFLGFLLGLLLGLLGSLLFGLLLGLLGSLLLGLLLGLLGSLLLGLLGSLLLGLLRGLLLGLLRGLLLGLLRGLLFLLLGSLLLGLLRGLLFLLLRGRLRGLLGSLLLLLLRGGFGRFLLGLGRGGLGRLLFLLLRSGFRGGSRVRRLLILLLRSRGRFRHRRGFCGAFFGDRRGQRDRYEHDHRNHHA